MIPAFSLLGKTLAIYPILALAGIFCSRDLCLPGGQAGRAKRRRHDRPVAFFRNRRISGDASALRPGQPLPMAAAALSNSLLGVFLPGDVRHLGRLCILRRPAGRHFGRRSVSAGQGQVSCALVQSDRPRRCPVPHLRPDRLFLGGCCYGIPSVWGVTYRHSPVVEANGISWFPVQLVEAGWNLILFLLLSRLLRQGKGRLLPLYLALYAPARFLLEFLRATATGESSSACPPPNGSACFCSLPPCFFSYAAGINKDFTPGSFAPQEIVVY